MSTYSGNDHDSDDTTPNVPAGATGSPGVPCGAPDVSPPAGSSTANQPKFVVPAGTSTNNEPRPEDFMGGGSEY
jgi:hypothetical protein